MRRLGFQHAIGCLLILTLACQAEDRLAHVSSAVRDSAGVLITESLAPAWGPEEAWYVSEAPRWSIGTVSGTPESQLYRVQDGHRFADGRVIVANAGTHELRFYDADGRLESASGGEGDGPGEFSFIARIDVSGDSVYVYDRGARRVSVFTANSRFVRSFSLPEIEGRPPVRPLGQFTDGSLLAAAEPTFWLDDRRGFYRTHDILVRVGPTGTVLDTLGEFPGTETYVEAQGEGVASMAVPFARTSVTAVSSNAFYFGANDEHNIDRYSIDGRLERRIRITRPNRPATVADLDAFIASLKERAPTEEIGRGLEVHYRRMPLPDLMPAYSSLAIDAPGNLWVEDYRALPFGPSDWSVFDADGKWLGTVALPDGFTPYQIGANFILGRTEDDLDVEYIEMYDLHKPR